MDRSEYRDEGRPRLQSLAQGARATHLKQIRGTLLTIGIFTLIFNGIDASTVPMQIRNEMAKNGGAAANAPGAETIRFTAAYTVIGAGLFLGGLFVVFGALVHAYPVPITIASLVMYTLTSIVCVGLSLFTVGPGSIVIVAFRIVFIVALARAVKTAFVYQKERQLEQTIRDEDPLDDLEMAAPAVRPRPAPQPDYRDEHGIQADAPRAAPRAEPDADNEPILLGAEHMQAGLPRTAPPTFASAPTGAAPIPVVPALSRPKPIRERSTELLGQEFVIDLGRPWTGFILGMTVLAGIGTIGASAPAGAWVAIPVVLLFTAILCLFFFMRKSTRHLRFTDDGVELTYPNETLAYNEILEIFAPERGDRRGKSFPIHLLCERSYCTIPATVRTDSETLYRFLRTQPLGERAIPAVPRVLRDFLKQQFTVHGLEDIYIYRPRLSLRSTRGAGLGEWLCLSLVPAGLALIIIDIALGQRAIGIGIGIGIPVVFIGFLVYLGAVLRRKLSRVTFKNWQQASLIIGPDGLALVQGDLTGELRWHELQRVAMTAGVSGTVDSFALTKSKFPGITLVVAGATITIADIYHWPLSHVRDRIEEYCQER
jgi:hypothetical protein